MTGIRAIIADDEAPVRALLRSRLALVWPELEIAGEAANGLEALDLMRSVSPDVAFLDIRMPGMSGMEAAARAGGACLVVFVTAYDDHAVEAFENEALDYLLKPVGLKRLEKTVSRLKERLKAPPSEPARLLETLARLARTLDGRTAAEWLQWVRARTGNDIRLIPVEDVLYFQAEDKYTRVVTGDREDLIRKPIRELAEELDPRRFWRIHRGTIVNARQVSRVSPAVTGGASVRLRGRDEILTASRRFARVFKQM